MAELPNNMRKKATIIGAGIGGLAAALRLASMNFEVEVLEANEYPGGKLSAFNLNGYRFDAGPSLFTMPFLVDELIETAGFVPEEEFSYKKMTTICHYFYPDGTRFNAYADINKFAKEIEEKLKISSEPLRKHLNHSKFLYKHTAELFMMRSLHQIKNYFNSDVLKAALNVHKFGLFKSMNKSNQEALNHPKLVQYFNRFATYNGSDPYQSPAVMNIIPHLEHHQGAFFPIGGMHQITKTIYNLCLKKNVVFHFNQKVDEILISGNKAIGIATKNKEHLSDIVVSNMDIVPSYRKLLPKQPAPEKTLRQERSSSALIFYWGIKKEFKELGLHNIFFSDNYTLEFEKLFKEYTLTKDPTVYVNISSKEHKPDAPEGCENWFVMINAPSHKNQDWPALIAEARKNILKKLSGLLNCDIESLIACEEVLSPPIIEEKTSSFGGALYGAASNNRMAAFLRHPNFSSKIKDLYFVGGSVHPGGGIPLCLLSAKITSSIIGENYSQA